MLGECFRRGGRKNEMEKKDERIAKKAQNITYHLQSSTSKCTNSSNGTVSN